MKSFNIVRFLCDMLKNWIYFAVEFGREWLEPTENISYFLQNTSCENSFIQSMKASFLQSSLLHILTPLSTFVPDKIEIWGGAYNLDEPVNYRNGNKKTGNNILNEYS